MNLAVPVSEFVKCAEVIMRKPKGSCNIFNRRFSAFFGTDVGVCAKLWVMIPREKDGKPCHMLWALLFLKLYESEHVHATLCNCDETTFRRWSKVYVEHISRCRIVRNCVFINFKLN